MMVYDAAIYPHAFTLSKLAGVHTIPFVTFNMYIHSRCARAAILPGAPIKLPSA